MSEKELGIQTFGNALMLGKFFSIVSSECVDLSLQGTQQVDDGLFHPFSTFVWLPGNQGKPRLAICQRDLGPAMVAADDGIEFPVTDA